MCVCVCVCVSVCVCAMKQALCHAKCACGSEPLLRSSAVEIFTHQQPVITPHDAARRRRHGRLICNGFPMNVSLDVNIPQEIQRKSEEACFF